MRKLIAFIIIVFLITSTGCENIQELTATPIITQSISPTPITIEQIEV